MIDYIIFEGVSGNSYAVDQVMDLPLSDFETEVESRNDETNIVQRNGNWPEFDYLGKRTWHIEGDLMGADVQDYWRRRQLLMACFEPRAELGFTYTVRLHMKFSGIDEEIISDCNLDGHPTLPLTALAPGISNCQINLKSADPRCYGINVNALETSAPVVTGGRTYAKTYPKVYASGSTGGTGTVIVAGNARTAPQVQIFGQCSSPSLQTFDADGTVHSFSLDNLFINDGDNITVDFRLRTVTSSNGLDLSGAIRPGSEWLTLPPGPNDIQFTALTPSGNCHAEWRWQNAYFI